MNRVKDVKGYIVSDFNSAYDHWFSASMAVVHGHTENAVEDIRMYDMYIERAVAKAATLATMGCKDAMDFADEAESTVREYYRNLLAKSLSAFVKRYTKTENEKEEMKQTIK